jgi:hypothetical protein
MIEPAFEQADIAAREHGATGGHRFQQRLDRMSQIADGVDAGHAGTALQRVQIALQAGEDLVILRGFAQGGEQAVAMVEQVAPFFDEDLDQLHVQPALVERLLVLLRRLQGRRFMPGERAGRGIGKIVDERRPGADTSSACTGPGVADATSDQANASPS